MPVRSDRGLFFIFGYYICHNKMVFVNCVIEENSPTQASIDTCADVNCISQKNISELGITYHSENNSIETPDAIYSTIGKVNLHIGFNDSEKHKAHPVNSLFLNQIGWDLI